MGFSFTVVVGIPQLYRKLMDFSIPATLGSNLSYSYYSIFKASIQIETCFLYPFHLVDYHLPKTSLNFPYL